MTSKFQSLCGADILRAAGTLITEVKAVNTNKLLKKAGEIFPSVDTLAFTSGNVIMGNVDNLSSSGPLAWRLQPLQNLGGASVGSLLGRDDIQATGHLQADRMPGNDSEIKSCLSHSKTWEIISWGCS